MINVEMVREFTKACNAKKKLQNTPVFLNSVKVTFLISKVKEEMSELLVAETIGQQADAMIDAIYYILNVACENGINLEPIFEIVHKFNMKKVVDGKVLRDGNDGKVLKPEGWFPPDKEIDAEISRQQVKGAFKK